MFAPVLFFSSTLVVCVFLPPRILYVIKYLQCIVNTTVPPRLPTDIRQTLADPNITEANRKRVQIRLENIIYIYLLLTDVYVSDSLQHPNPYTCIVQFTMLLFYSIAVQCQHCSPLKSVDRYSIDLILFHYCQDYSCLK